MKTGTRIQVGNVEGITNKKGLKQNKIYTVLSHGCIHEGCDLSNFYQVTDGKRMFQIWDVNRDLSVLMISKDYKSTASVIKDFKILSD